MTAQKKSWYRISRSFWRFSAQKIAPFCQFPAQETYRNLFISLRRRKLINCSALWITYSSIFGAGNPCNRKFQIRRRNLTKRITFRLRNSHLFYNFRLLSKLTLRMKYYWRESILGPTIHTFSAISNSFLNLDLKWKTNDDDDQFNDTN